MIILRRVAGGYTVKLRYGVPPLFVGQRSAAITLADHCWWMTL